MTRLLILENDENWRRCFSDALKEQYELSFWPDGKDVYEKLKSEVCNLIIMDSLLQPADHFDLLNWIKSNMPDVPLLVTSGTEDAEFVVKSIKQGAFDFIAKPFTAARITHAIELALEDRSLKNERDYLRHEQDVVYDFDKIVAFSPSMKKIIGILKKFSKTNSTILVTGETGTGKSFLSGSIHFNSHRKNKPFIKINCANIPETLLESELFGHEKGSFTGADKLRIGRIEQANGGTVFLDEIGETSLPLQAKMLRVVEEKSFERVGSNKTIHSDVRIIAATNRNLEELVQEGNFRKDLYYRINVLSASLPPLRERKLCIEPLAYSLLHNSCRSLKKRIDGFSHEALAWMIGYTWPGNIRQLANAIERAVIMEEADNIQPATIAIPEQSIAEKKKDNGFETELVLLDGNMRERNMIIQALEQRLWIQKDAAMQLGVSPRVLNYKIKKHGITHNRWKKHR